MRMQTRTEKHNIMQTVKAVNSRNRARKSTCLLG